MSLLRKLFIEDEDVPAQPQATETAPTVQTPTPPPRDEKARTLLMQALEEVAGKVPGIDYFKFKKTVDALRESISDERVRYVSAYTTAKALGGAQKNTIVESTGRYLSALDQEQQEFIAAIDEEFRAKVTDGKAKVEDIKTAIQRKLDEQKKLEDEIVQLKQTEASLSQKIGQEEARIASVKGTFGVTHAALVKEIQDDITRIKNYLGD
jgi:chromosome segregation ATPase